ncbi:MAG: hypothetical protein HYZ57_10750 [Acidobacteria bacterium]|nr:hypothetical protein [Acidobacteriota bacterium]MBI3280308.1 hypothetical protein [Acidobacteriota bacterium]
MLNVKAWQGKLTIKGSASGVISGPAGTENYVVSWNVTAEVVLDQQNAAGRFWSGTIKGTGASTISHSITWTRSDGCRMTNEIKTTGAPTVEGGGLPLVMLFAGVKDDYAFFTNAVMMGKATTTIQGSGSDCSGSTTWPEAPWSFWPEELDRDKLFPLQSGMNLSNTGQYEMVFPLVSFNASLTGQVPKPKVTVTMEFKPLVKDELILEVTSAKYKDWLPTAKHSGAPAAAIQPGDPLEFTAELKMKNGGQLSEKATHFTWELIDVSKEPGVALNWPPNGTNYTDPDLKFEPFENQIAKDEQKQRIETAPGQYTSDKAKVAPYDWGGWGVLKVKAHFATRDPVEGQFKDSGEADIRIPKRDRNSYIADAWKTSPAGASGGDYADTEKDPEGDATEGDGLSLYEEYRGFYEKRVHKYANSKKKDFFINNQMGSAALGGILVFYRASGLDVHWDILDDELNLGRIINYLKDRGPSNNDQHGVRIIPILNDRPYAEAVGGPSTPKNIVRVEIPVNWSSASAMVSGVTAFDQNIAHELFHACNVWHHGEGDAEPVFWSRDPATGALMFGEHSIALYLEDGTDVTMRPGVGMRRWIGVMGGQHSGDDTCVMRYTAANTYPAKNIPGETFYSTREVSGYTLCGAPKGTGVNSDSRPSSLESRFGDATRGRGDCKHQILVNDRAQPPQR